MKIYSIKKVAYVSFTLSLLSSAAKGGNDYSNVFTEDIYDQPSSLSRNFSNKEEKKKAILDHLRTKKEEALKRCCFKEIEDEISTWDEEYKLAVKVKDERDRRLFIGGIISSIFQIATSAIPTIGKGIAGAIGSSNEILTNLPPINVDFRGIEQRVDMDLRKQFKGIPCEPAGLREKIITLTLKQKSLLRGLENEPIKDLEERYVFKKGKMNNEQLKVEIEKALLDARKSDFNAPVSFWYLENALKLPLKSNRLIDSQNYNTSQLSLMKKFDEHQLLQTYSPKVKQELKNIVSRVAKSSVSSAPSVSKRECLYFVGSPSTGKTTAAIETAKLLDLPSYIMTARHPSEFSEANIEGADRLMGSPNAGLLAKVLMEVLPSKNKAYTNGFLIINDLDRILKDGTSVLAFLLDFLDPQKTDYYNNYFRSKIDISRLNIIITANEEIPESKEFDALRTRITQIKFPELKEDQMEKILDQESKAQHTHQHLPDIVSLEYAYDLSNTPTVIAHFAKEGHWNKKAISSISQAVSERLQDVNCSSIPGKPHSIRITIPNGKQVGLREMKEKALKTVISVLGDVLIKKGEEWFQDAERANDLVQKLVLYKRASDLGHREASLKLNTYFQGIDDPQQAQYWKTKTQDLSPEAFFYNPDDATVQKLLNFLPHPIKMPEDDNGKTGWTTPFHVAVRDKSESLLNALLRGHNQARVKTLLTGGDSDGNSPFHVAVRENNKAMLDLLLQKCSHGLNMKGADQCTPIMLAVNQGHSDIVEFLYEKGADMTIKDKDGCTVLQKALMKRNQNLDDSRYSTIVEYLLEKSPAIVDSEGQPTNLCYTTNYKMFSRWNCYNRALNASSRNLIATNDVKKDSEFEVFRFIPSSTPGYYFIENVRSKKVLHVPQGGNSVITAENDNTHEDRRLFQFIKKNDGYFIQNKGSELVLYTSAAGLVGDRPITAEYNNGSCYSQKLFKIQAVDDKK